MLNLRGVAGGGGGGVGFCDFKAHLADISSGSARAVQLIAHYSKLDELAFKTGFSHTTATMGYFFHTPQFGVHLYNK